MEIFNKYLVGARGEGIVILNPPRGEITKEEALQFAAFIVAIANEGDRFSKILEEVEDA